MTDITLLKSFICCRKTTSPRCPLECHFYAADDCPIMHGAFPEREELAQELVDAYEIIKSLREVLSSNLKDLDKIDLLCKTAGVHPYTIMRSEIEQALEKSKEYAK